MWRLCGHREPEHFDPKVVAEMKKQIKGTPTGGALMRDVGRARGNMRKEDERRNEDHEVPEG